MGKLLTDAIGQVRELIGDYQATTFTDANIQEAIGFGMNVIMRDKGFNRFSRLYSLGISTSPTYPTGVLPDDWLIVKRVMLVQTPAQLTPPLGHVGGPYGVDSDDSTDVVIRVLEESSLPLEDATNENWRNVVPNMMPRRWALVGNKQFVVIPPQLPAHYNYIVSGMVDVRVHYEKMASFVDVNSDGNLWIDPNIPNYYQDAIRYIASAYLLEKDTDLKLVQLKGEFMKSFEYHMKSGPMHLGTIEQDG